MTDVETLARRLIAVPSHRDETAVGDVIERWLREHTDGRVERDRHGNVLARRGTGDPSLALVGHHDVVPPSEGQVIEKDGNRRYRVVERDGRLYGRGSADMKGAVAAAMCAFERADIGEGTLVFVSFVGEETGGEGARGAIEDGFAPTYAVVGEGSTGYSAPGVTDVAVAHKGRRASTITARGKTAHASDPADGTNAIYRATAAIDRVRELATPTATVFDNDLTGSLVVTEIEGGSAWNVVPERCEITVDERTVPGGRAPLEELTSLPGISWTVDQDLPPMACSDDAFVDRVIDAANAAQPDAAPERVTKPHATDAGWLARAGTECVVCGPAEPGEAHTDDESVSLAVLDRCAEIYRSVAEACLVDER